MTVAISGMPPPKSSKKMWIATSVLLVLSFLFAGMGSSSSSGILSSDVEDCRFFGDPSLVGYPEYDTCEEMEADRGTGDLFMTPFFLTCCGGIITGIIALSTTKKGNVIIVQQQPQQFVQMAAPVQYQQPHPTQQYIPPVRQPAPPVQRSAGQIQAEFLVKKKLDHLKIAQQRETARDYEAAIVEYEAAEEFAEAGRIRQLMQSQGTSSSSNAPVQVNIGHVGTSNVQDSVVMGDTVPAQASGCTSCGKPMDAAWAHCPFCQTPR